MTNDIGPSARYWERDVVDPPWVMKGGALAVPDGPGLGVAVDRERVEADAVRTERLEAS